MPRKKRAKGEGTIYQDAKGVWWVYLPPDEMGRRPKRRAKSQKEAIEKMRLLLQERKQGLNLDSRRPTVEEFGKVWHATVVQGKVKASTADGYAQMLKRHINPGLGKIRLDKLTTPRIQTWVNNMALKYAVDTVRNAYLRLRSLLKVAVQYRIISFNPAIGVVMPKPQEEDEEESHTLLTAAQYRLLIEAAEGRYDAREKVKHQIRLKAPDRIATLYHIFLLGLRRGEALGLPWRNIDLDTGTIKITQQVQYIDRRVQIVKGTKTSDSRRELPLPPALVERLKAHKAAQDREQQVCDDWSDTGLVFTTDNGNPISPSNMRRHFLMTLERAGLPSMRLHDLRHTAATLMGDRDVPDRVIAAILGHAPPTITAHYAETTTEAMRRAIEGLYEEVMR